MESEKALVVEVVAVVVAGESLGLAKDSVLVNYHHLMIPGSGSCRL